MKCPACGRSPGATTAPCPHCPNPSSVNDAHLPATGTERSSTSSAVEPEVLAPGEAEGRGGQDIFSVLTGQQYRQGQHARHAQQGQHAQYGQQGQHEQQQASGFRYVHWQSATGAGGLTGGLARDSCLPGLLTLFFALLCSVQFGLLAGIGFLVFTLLGSAFTFMGNIRLIMQGQRVYPWLGRMAVWGASGLLVAWLSGGI